MEYTIRQLSALAGVSSRTLRHYDAVGLLRPLRTTDAGYRIYGPAEVDRLQQILFYRRLGLKLAEIGALLDARAFDELAALRGHREALETQRRGLDALIATVEKTIAAKEGRINMTDLEKFEGFKQELIDRNEAAYGPEIRERYGEEAVDAANRKLMGLRPEDFDRVQALEQELLAALDAAYAVGAESGSAQARRVAELHREWLGFYWADYSPEAHAGLVRMYVEDARFAAYYDRGEPGRAAYLRDAVLAYLSV